jgi:hypothetical protein
MPWYQGPGRRQGLSRIREYGPALGVTVCACLRRRRVARAARARPGA